MQSHLTFSRAVLGGLVGTVAMTATMYLVAPMMGVHMDIAAMLGSALDGSWTAGLMMHVVNGALIFPAIFAFALFSRLPGSPAVKGITWGVALWFMQQMVVLPMMGGGIFSSQIGGPMTAMGALVAHVMYGGVLGVIAGARIGQARAARA